MYMDQRIRQRLNEIRQKQLETQQSAQETNTAPISNNNSHYLYALLGMAAGFIISIIVWMVTPLSKTNEMKMIMPESHVSIDANEINKANEHIGRLNDRLELLTQSIYALETRLNRLMNLPDSNHDAGMMPAHSYQKHMAEAANTGTTIDANELAASVGSPSTKTGNSFIPTHKATTNLNLRPSASLDSTPVATLSAGTKVEYILESGGWYYVNTEQHGKGWCASGYLSPLQPSLSSPQAVDQES
jgi:glucan-binding YG repeat protein